MHGICAMTCMHAHAYMHGKLARNIEIKEYTPFLKIFKTKDFIHTYLAHARDPTFLLFQVENN